MEISLRRGLKMVASRYGIYFLMDLLCIANDTYANDADPLWATRMSNVPQVATSKLVLFPCMHEGILRTRSIM